MLTDKSKIIIDNIVSTIKKTNIKSNKSKESNTTNKLIVKLFDQIIESHKFVDKNINIYQCKSISTVSSSTPFIKKYVSNIDYNYVDKQIIKYIETNKGLLIQYTFNLDKKYIIYFILYEKITAKNRNSINDKLDFYAKNMITVILFLENYRKIGCKTDKLEIFIYLTPFEKKLPKKHEIIGPKSINSGHTIPCNMNSEIVVYRREEFFKVVIHELIHSMGIELASIHSTDLEKRLHNIFNIKSNFKINEAYTEFWSNFVNILFYISLIHIYKKSLSKKLLTSLFHELYYVEKINTYIQCIKLLNHMNLKYSDLFSKNIDRLNLYREKTSVFAYFMCKLIFMNNHDKFIEFVLKNNSNILLFSNSYNIKENQRKMNNLINYIEKNYKDRDLLTYYDELEKWYMRQKSQSYFFYQTRMTCIEYL
tara:strand:- start:1361 stop:2629 length:1269 start_codon:yes stop_codon:yes gene_type:complete